jgi:hypothetical protein
LFFVPTCAVALNGLLMIDCEVLPRLEPVDLRATFLSARPEVGLRTAVDDVGMVCADEFDINSLLFQLCQLEMSLSLSDRREGDGVGRLFFPTFRAWTDAGISMHHSCQPESIG